MAALVDSGPDGLWAESLLVSEALASPHLMPVEAASILRRAALSGDISTDPASLAHQDLIAFLRVELFPYEPLAVRVWELRTKDWIRVTTTQERLGVTGHAGWLAAFPYAPRRGSQFLQRFVCANLSEPPPNLIIPGELLSRAEYEALTKDPACAGCHQLFDRVGFAFEHYDVYGQYRTHIDGQPVDTGSVVNLLGVTTQVAGHQQLMQLASDGPLQVCAMQQVGKYASFLTEDEETREALTCAAEHLVSEVTPPQDLFGSFRSFFLSMRTIYR